MKKLIVICIFIANLNAYPAKNAYDAKILSIQGSGAKKIAYIKIIGENTNNVFVKFSNSRLDCEVVKTQTDYANIVIAWYLKCPIKTQAMGTLRVDFITNNGFITRASKFVNF